MKTKLLFLLLLPVFTLTAQINYFPPLLGGEWETISPEELGWCTEHIPPLLEYLEAENTKAFLILKDGKIVLEEYFGDTNMNTNLPWNSAGKTITALLVGIAQEDGLLNINDATSDYLGSGWTSLSPEQEDSITIWNQLTMTSGLDDAESFCTDPECLQYLADPGTRWAYHNAPYTLLSKVIENASGLGLNTYAVQNLNIHTGIGGAFVTLGYNEVYFSPARGMARMGLLMLNGGTWDGTSLLSDNTYFNQLTQTSQELNPAYGYLWWLNGQDSYILPGGQFPFSGSLAPNAPAEMVSGIGKNGQFLNLIPSENLVVIRMGGAPNEDLVPITFHNDMWSLLTPLICEVTPANEINNTKAINLYPNPVRDEVTIESGTSMDEVLIYDTQGRLYSLSLPRLTASNGKINILVDQLPPGLYLIELKDMQGNRYLDKFVKK